MKNHLLLIFIINLIFNIFSFSQGNGSTGVGTAKELNDDIIILGAGDLQIEDSKIIDLDSNKALLSFHESSNLVSSEFKGGHFVHATFGNLPGYEFIKDKNSLYQSQDSFWILCRKDHSKCYEFHSLEKNHIKIQNILGSALENYSKMKY